MFVGGRIRRMVEIDNFEGLGRDRQALFEPARLNGLRVNAVRLSWIAVNGVEMDRAAGKIIVPAVTGQNEIGQIGPHVLGFPIMIAKGWEASVDVRSSAVNPMIGCDEGMIVAADVPADRGSGAGGIVVIADR